LNDIAFKFGLTINAKGLALWDPRTQSDSGIAESENHLLRVTYKLSFRKTWIFARY